MPLHGKIVVIKRSGVDGTEFPLTASCLFGRKQECDIRIQLPSVSKEHCRIDLNENKEVILTNLSSANPTCVNGEALHQSERLKHGDVITIVDRSFRFEYPPAPTPKKRSSTGAKSETLKVLRDHQVSDSVIAGSGERRNFEVSTGRRFKDGANIDIQRSLEKTLEEESKEDGGHLQSKTNSPFGDLYQMIKKSLDVKTPRKSCVSQVQTPSSKFCTPRPGSVMKIGRKSANFTPKKDDTKLLEEPKFERCESPQSGKKLGKTISVSPATVRPRMKEDECAAESEATSKQRRSSGTVQRFTASEVLEMISAPALKSPTRRMSKETKLAQTAEEQEQQGTASPKATPKRTSPRTSGAAETEVPKKHKRGDLESDLLGQKIKKKRVSFGGHLSPELFDKRLPPDSPLRRGATPRRSLSLCKPKQSVFRRASVIGFLKAQSSAKTPSPKNSLGVKGASPKTPPGKKLPKCGSSSPKATSPGKKAPKSASPVQMSPKFKSLSPKGTPLLQESLRSRSTSPKAVTPKTSPRSMSSSPAPAKSRSPSPKVVTPAKTSSRSSSPALAKSRSPSPKVVTPAKTSSRSSSPALAKSRSSSPKVVTPAKTSSRSSSPAPAKSRSPSPKVVTPAKTSSRSSSPALAKSRSTSPKVVTPAKTSSRSSSPALAKSRSTSPKVVTPAKTSSRSSSPAKESKIQCRSGSPGQKSYNTTPTDKRRSSLRESSLVSLTGVTPVKASLDSGVSTPNVQGRFSVSRISTPSPTSEVDAVTHQEPLSTVTPKIQLKRRSMKRTSRRTSGVSKSAARVLQRKSGVSRASMRAINSWADIVKFGQAKTQVVAPTKKKVAQKPKKKVSKLQTPARTLKSHASTGHADSPATIFVGRAHKRAVAHPTGAAPRVVTNTALYKKDMKMDENLSGISEMFKTPANRKRRSSITERSARKSQSVIEQTVLNTPEEPGEMIVSPLNGASTVKSRRYNSEAVQRLLNEEQESSFIGDTPALEVRSKSGEEQDADFKMSAATPIQKPELAESLPEVKRIVKTPKEKPEQIDCLTGVKRIMKTPRQKAEPVEDLRGKILKTPRQKAEQQEHLTGVKRIMKTPRQKAEPVEDLRGKLLKTPKTREAVEVSFDGIKELLETPAQVQKSDHQSEMTNVKSPNIKSSSVVCLTNVKRVVKTPKEKYSPVEDMVGVKRLMRTPKEKGKPVEDHFGINRLMRSPRLRGVAPVEDFEGLPELLQEQEPSREVETNKVKMETLPQEAAEAPQQQPKEEASPYKVKEMDASTEEKPVRGRKGKTVIFKTTEDKVNVPEPSEDPVVSAPVRGRRGKKTDVVAPAVVSRTTRGRNAEASHDMESTPQPSKSAPRPRRGRNATKAPEDPSETVQEVTEEQVSPDPEGEQRPSTGFQHEVEESDAQVGKAELKPKRGMKNKRVRNKPSAQTEEVAQAEDTNNAHSEQPEVLPDTMEAVVQAPDVQEVTEEQVSPDPEGEQRPSTGFQHEVEESDAQVEEAELKPKRGMKNKRVRNKLSAQTEEVAQAEVPEADTNKAHSEQPEVLPDTMEAVVQAPDVQEVTEKSAAPVQKKPVRGRRAKLSEPKEKQEASQRPDELVSARVRGRRGKQTEVTAPPAVQQVTRRGNAKSQKSASNQPVKAQVIPEVSPDAASVQTSLNTTQEAEEPGSTAQVTLKLVRGRKTKLAPVALENTEAASKDDVNAQPPQPVPAAAGKPTRGRKRKCEEQNELVENTVVTEDVEQQFQPPVRAKRGRNAQQKEEEQTDSGAKTTSQKTSNCPEPVKKSRRTGKPVDHKEEDQPSQMVVPHEAEILPAEPVVMPEQAVAATKPRRGGRKAKPDTKAEVPEEAVEVPAVSTDTPKRGRGGKRVTQKVASVENLELESEEQKNICPSPQITKATRAKGRKKETPEDVPAKRARRGAATHETNGESAVQTPAPAPAPVKPAQRGKQASAKPTRGKEAPMTDDPANPSKVLSEPAIEESKLKKSVQFESDLQVFEIPKPTPVKAGRGRKAKLADVKSDNGSKVVKPEEDLSDVKAQPVKRGRRGVKVVDVAAEPTREEKDAEAKPQTRRGRSARK